MSNPFDVIDVFLETNLDFSELEAISFFLLNITLTQKVPGMMV